MPTFPQQLSTSQAAERLGLSREHVRRLIQRGELHAEETVNGFMLHTGEIEQYAIQRRVLQDQRQFRAAVDDLAVQARRIDEAMGIQKVIAQIRDQMKSHSAFDVPAIVAPQMKLIEQEMATQKTLAALAGPAATVAEQWRRYEQDARRVIEQAEGDISGHDKMPQAMNRDSQQARTSIRERDRIAALARKDNLFATIGLGKPLTEATPRPPELARGFVIAEPREVRLEEKMDELSRKVEQLTDFVMQQPADATTAMPTWQAWAGSDRPEDVLAKVATIREEITGGKQAGENSTDIIREAREARGRGV